MDKPFVLITGATGNIGSSLASALSDAYTVIGLDGEGSKADFPLIGVDFTDDDSVPRALQTFRRDFGERIASVIHLVAFFDFSGDDNPLYESVNVEGTRRLLRGPRPLCFLNLPPGLALIGVPFIYDGDKTAVVFSLVAGLLLGAQLQKRMDPRALWCLEHAAGLDKRRCGSRESILF